MFNSAHFKMADFTKAGGENVVLTKAPYNLSPVVATIIARATEVRKNLNGRPLVIMMGEDHSVSSHVISQLLTISEMQQRYKINKAAYAVELPYNHVVPLLTIVDGDSDDTARTKIENDHTGNMSLNRILKMGGWYNASFSQISLLNHCLSKSIPTCFADAATLPDDRFLMDCEDPFVRQYLVEKGKDMANVLRSDSPFGVEIRNHFMVNRVQSLIKNTNATTVVMGVGNDHIFGVRNQLMFDASLANLFYKAAMDFMVVIPFGKHIPIQQLPHEALEFFPQTIGVLGMDEKEFLGNAKKSELAYIQKIVTASGRASKVPSPSRG